MTLVCDILRPDHAAPWLTLREEGARDFPLAFLFSEARARATSEKQARRILEKGSMHGVFDGEDLIGFCGLSRKRWKLTRHRATIGPVFVTRDRQGGGAAALLLDHVIRAARDNGVAQLELFVDTNNTRAIRFFESFGFERVALHPDRVRDGDTSRDSYFYRLRSPH
ncbi:GNAT family N-acetyltransferase [Palleronia rufa]|uniref:GNAT family N-acetyltransferase n=1 Tax=Palleronia rufa TaxID=1530186 RepID=UPI00068E3FB3|nr:GNAT family N-acetyltransferase [Palleronia rufa]